jgi:hypothetical protein
MQNTSTDHLLGFLMLCCCSKLDPCCLKLLTVEACRGGNKDVALAGFLCLFKQWCDRRPPGGPSFQQYPPTQYYSAPPAEACSDDWATLLYACLGADGARHISGFLDTIIKTMGAPRAAAAL